MSLIVFPAIDLKGGQVVRLAEGDMDRATVYGDDPAAQAMLFAEAGAQHLHVVDLDGSFAGRAVNAEAVESIVRTFPGHVQLGGGIRNRESVECWFDLGVSRIVIGTAALKDPEFVKGAARDFVEAVFSHPDADVKVGVVPFAQYANVGETYAGSAWLTDGGAVWTGCVGSRNYPLNVADEEFATTRVPGLLNEWCAAEVLPMTASKTAVKNRISSLYVQGDTYIPAGLSWGLRLISADAPFTEGATYADLEADAGVKAIVLMTDGANTRSPRYPDHWGSSVSLANTLTREICDEIKSKKIFIHTIAFEVSDNSIQNLLRNCASDPSDFYDAGNAAELAQAFNSIGDDLKRLALTR